MNRTPVLITGAVILDGDGRPPFPADVVVEESLIAGVEPPGSVPPDPFEVLDASGMVVAPGFIDVHSHADNAPFLEDADTSKILQGVTTEVVGNCGFSLGPALPTHRGELAELVARFFPPGTPSSPSFTDLLVLSDELGYVTNVAPLVGHHALRVGTAGRAARRPGAQELAAMGDLLREALDAGAFGLSSGLIYDPGMFAPPAELTELVAQLPAGGVYATHVRGEGRQLRQSVEEALAVARHTGRAVHISHLKVAGRPYWGAMPEVLSRIDDARRQGHDIRHDVYPYTAGSTVLSALLPPWVRDGSTEQVLRRLQDPDVVKRLRADLARDGDDWENLAFGSGWENIVIASSSRGEHDGKSLRHIADELAREPADTLVHLLLTEHLRISMVIHSMCESDLRTALVHPQTMIGSDGLPPGARGLPHPRQFGTFPRVLSRYVRETGLLTLEDAVRRMTSLPAAAFGLVDRGSVRPGMVADLVAFDPATVQDTATYTDPIRSPEGIAWVMLAGRVVARDGRYLGGRHGMRLVPRHP
ncbi:N-acyl-D-amino-acid deacylase family protein [Microtetraspora fusca]|uniref:N-acyl-D-amino-acid deacylase family protein n=1 Tax=Microtetraspora fusca TaxID=1997 RepID=UPI000829CC4D|nr:D-aminoacylase [Microtetraspora fusca]